MTDQGDGRPAGRLRCALRAVGRPRLRDAVSGLVTGLFSVPEGMAYANISGFSPVFGLYAGIVPTIVGSFFARTVLMVTTLTSAIALSSQSVLAAAGLGPTDPRNVATLTVMVGAVMLLMGLLRLGAVMSFVSTAVMTGFTTGIAVQIVVGVLGDATGYEPRGHNKLVQLADWVAGLAHWQPVVVAVAAATIVVWALARALPGLKPLATLVALAAVSVAVALLGVEVELVRDIAAIPSGLPVPALPAPQAVPHLLVGAVAVAMVALAQAAGIGSAVPNPDGSRGDMNRDFIAQGAANIAGGFFRSLPTGGSLSRTGVATSAGAQTRWAGIFAGVWLLVVVLMFGRYAELIPMPVIGGLIIVIGVELVAGRVPDIILVARTAPVSALAMAVTFLATTQLPLQHAILLGAGLSLLLYCVQAARAGRMVRLVRQEGGRWRTDEPPAALGRREVVVLAYEGSGFFAELPSLDQRWPDVHDARRSVLIVRLRGWLDIPSAGLVRILRRRVGELRERDCRLMLAGVDPAMRRVLDRSGVTALVGQDAVFTAGPEVFGALEAAEEYARAWIAGPGDDGTNGGGRG